MAKRFEVLEKWDLDGYRVAKVAPVFDLVDQPSQPQGVTPEVNAEPEQQQITPPEGAAAADKAAGGKAAAAAAVPAVPGGSPGGLPQINKATPDGKLVNGGADPATAPLDILAGDMQTLVKEWLVRTPTFRCSTHHQEGACADTSPCRVWSVDAGAEPEQALAQDVAALPPARDARGEEAAAPDQRPGRLLVLGGQLAAHLARRSAVGPADAEVRSSSPPAPAPAPAPACFWWC